MYNGITCRNPFFIRSVFVRHALKRRKLPPIVAIPFSSGLCSFLREKLDSYGLPYVAIPFSSGLCSFYEVRGYPRRDRRRNPFFIRSVFVQEGGTYV